MTSHHFVPIAIETSGVFGSEAITFFKELGHWTKFESGDPRSFHFLIQRAAVAIQRGNTAAAVLGTLPWLYKVTIIIVLYFLYEYKYI